MLDFELGAQHSRGRQRRVSRMRARVLAVNASMTSPGLSRSSSRRPVQLAVGLSVVAAVAAWLIWRRPPSVATVPSAAAPDPVLAEEAQLMSGAQRALAAGDTDQAFSLLYEQATKFPKGKLAQQRELTHIRTLCRAGKAADAREEAAQFLAQHGDSRLATEVKTICPPSP